LAPAPRPTPTPASAPARTPTPRPTPTCPSQMVYDSRTGRCVPIGSNGGLG
jgi:hypothetical protein